MIKLCGKCQQEKSVVLFHKQKGGKFGVRRTCKVCTSAYDKSTYDKGANTEYMKSYRERPGVAAAMARRRRSRYHTDPEYRQRRLDYQREWTHGVTADEYRTRLVAQDYCCAICHGLDPAGRALAVDHDHKTGRIRELLCTDCNTALGSFKDNVKLLLEAVLYLTRHTVSA